MKLAISNIAWLEPEDERVYNCMKQYGFSGLEIAPTRIVPDNPYDNAVLARARLEAMRDTYGYEIPSMQSIWYGRQEKIYGSAMERDILAEYTEKAIDWAYEIECTNLVFGCPRNRQIPADGDRDIAIKFFKGIGDYAYSKNVIVGLEANPTIYNTNFINTTEEALEFIDEVGSKGLKLNLDMGTMIYNGESLNIIEGNVNKISHVHISEPGLEDIQERPIHKALISILEDEGYRGYVSVEMGNSVGIDGVESAIKYVASLQRE